MFIIFISRPIDIKDGIWIGNKSSIYDTIISIKKIGNASAWGERSSMYTASFKMIKEKPIFGVGLGNWKTLYPYYSTNNHVTDKYQFKTTIRPHNDFLWVLCETGIFGIKFLLLPEVDIENKMSPSSPIADT